jgi:hypothetical protein
MNEMRVLRKELPVVRAVLIGTRANKQDDIRLKAMSEAAASSVPRPNVIRPAILTP